MKWNTPLYCPNPETCEEEHNPIVGYEDDPHMMHHYGCGCQECMLYYYLELK